MVTEVVFNVSLNCKSLDVLTYVCTFVCHDEGM